MSGLPALPLDEWSDTKLTLHLYLQVIGKIRLEKMPPQNHWWHVPLYVTSRGLTTRPIPDGIGAFEISLDFIEHTVAVSHTDNSVERFPLAGQSVSRFYEQLVGELDRLGVEVRIDERPYELPSDTPFSKDTEHSSYDAEYVQRFWRILVWCYGLMSRFAGRFTGKTTPVQLFWHSFDLALTRFSGKAAPPMEGAGLVAAEAYSHEVVSFGFWAGDDRFPEPAFYSYTWPEPAGLTEQPLQPEGADWVEQETGSLAVYPYERARSSHDPTASALTFLESAYQNGASLAGWDLEGLRHPRYG